ncbi:MAG TPA: hypothetical protein VFS43_02675 [Polyangiaceae bacterium]|nr:hypothetical protein [Polyangiaceae bacterium]
MPQHAIALVPGFVGFGRPTLDEARGKESVVDPGLLTSGASFGDETFFSFCAFVASKLVGLVARADAAPPPGARWRGRPGGVAPARPGGIDR